LSYLEQVKEVIRYDPDTGSLIWLTGRGPVKAGSLASSLDHYGYIDVTVLGKRWKGHRLSWLLHYGRGPSGHIDHINGDRSDNRISNLRECSPEENLWNTKVSGKGSSKFKGVSKMGKGFTAQITLGNKKKHLGCFLTEEEAALVYNHAAEKHYGKFARYNQVFEDVDEQTC
jgi:hypothetical protein